MMGLSKGLVWIFEQDVSFFGEKIWLHTIFYLFYWISCWCSDR